MIVPANAQYGHGEDSEKLYHYYAGVTYQFLEESHRDDAVFMYFGWGGERSVETVFDSHLRYGDTGRLMNRFLHPIFEANGIVREIHEDLDMSWTEPSYAVIVERVARYALDGNLSRFKPRVTHSFQRSQVNQTVEPDFESADLSQRVHGEFKEEVIPVIAASVYTNASEVGLQALKESVKAWMPALFDHEIISDVAAVDDVEPYHREL